MKQQQQNINNNTKKYSKLYRFYHDVTRRNNNIMMILRRFSSSYIGIIMILSMIMFVIISQYNVNQNNQRSLSPSTTSATITTTTTTTNTDNKFDTFFSMLRRSTTMTTPKISDSDVKMTERSLSIASTYPDVTSITALRGSEHHESSASLKHKNDQCRWYLAESAIPNGGLGVFTSNGLNKDDMIGFPDICIYVSDAPKQWTHLRSHSWGIGRFFGLYENSNIGKSRAACEGFGTIHNTMPNSMINTQIVSPKLSTNAGLHRDTSPGAGSITHYYGVHGKAIDTILPGSELTIFYGDWDFDEDKTYVRPKRPVDWLQQHAWCIDNIIIQRSNIPDAGRGAFARVSLHVGQVIAPAPLQIFTNRNLFQTTKPEQLFVNYCFQPYNSDMLLYPYGPGVNLINHHHTNPNVYIRWSTNELNQLHHHAWLDLSYNEFWDVVTPGSLVLEVIALRNIDVGEELLLDYGIEWDNAWKEHVKQWKPPNNNNNQSKPYIYPADIDETLPLRTVNELKKLPYPNHLTTICMTPDWHRKNENHTTWYDITADTDTSSEWFELMTYCHILERIHVVESDDYIYTVSLIFTYNDNKKLISYYNESIPLDKQYIDYQVPRHAIRFIEKPYHDDEHLLSAFRHPIQLPSSLTPISWQTNKTSTN